MSFLSALLLFFPFLNSGAAPERVVGVQSAYSTKRIIRGSGGYTSLLLRCVLFRSLIESWNRWPSNCLIVNIYGDFLKLLFFNCSMLHSNLQTPNRTIGLRHMSSYRRFLLCFSFYSSPNLSERCIHLLPNTMYLVLRLTLFAG